MTRHCLDCGAALAGRSPRCPEHRAARRRAVVSKSFARWYANPANARRHYVQQKRRLQTKRLHALADQLGYILVPL